MNTPEYLEQLAKDLCFDDEDLMEFVEEHFGDDPEPLNPASYYFCLTENDDVLIFPKVYYDTFGSPPEYPLFPVEEICANLDLQSKEESCYVWEHDDFNPDDILDALLEAGLVEMEL